jgi:hypothetical protein
LSATFADNVGVDEIVVYDGVAKLSSAFIGAAQGPKLPDITVYFTTPFHYNRGAGALLFETRTEFDSPIWMKLSGSGSSQDNAARVFSTEPESASGGPDTGADVLEFIYSLTP